MYNDTILMPHSLLHIFHCSQIRHSLFTFPYNNTLKANTTSRMAYINETHSMDTTIPHKLGRLVHQIPSCIAVQMKTCLLRWRGRCLPLTEYGKHPFRLVSRALGGNRLEKCQPWFAVYTVCAVAERCRMYVHALFSHSFKNCIQ